MQAGLQEGEKPPKMRAAREDDKFVISRDVEVTMNKITTPDGEYGPLTMRLMWSVKSRDVAIELKEENVQYCMAALKHSAPAVKAQPAEGDSVKASPKKRRRKLKRTRSAESQERENP